MGRASNFFYLLMVFWLAYKGNSEPVEDKEALLEFVKALPHLHSLNWKENSSVCGDWNGVKCSSDKSRVIAVRLPGVGFNGRIPINTLSRLSALETLSLRSNGISGPFPSDFYNLKSLTMLNLQFNNLSGSLPSDFSIWRNLTVLDLSNNRFNGSIPISLSNLTHLSALNLANNCFSGEIPDMGRPNLQELDLSHNNLSGIVPNSLRMFPNSAFTGNRIVLGNSSISSSASSASSHPSLEPKQKKLRNNFLLAIIIGCSVLGLLAFTFLLVVCCTRRKGEEGFTGKFPKGSMSPEKAISGEQDSRNGLVFFEGCNYAFDLEDLLRASAEVLGKGTFGMSYKVILEDANVVAVKRLKDVSAGKREFEQQMEVIGSIRHENVVALRAYYYSKDEKLMVNDYCSQGSVSTLLHGKRDGDRVPLEWEIRLKIAIGAARGITHVHTTNGGGRLVHGNIRSSNIFLNAQQYGCISDFGLATVMSSLAPPISRAAGYRAPEITDTRKPTPASDVYSFGVFLLELLTGKSPVHTTGGDELVHLVRWVHSVVREEWTAEVFDLELLRYPHVEEEMVEMLQIAMSCVARVPEQRPRMADVLTMIENVRHNDAEIQNESSSAVSPSK